MSPKPSGRQDFSDEFLKFSSDIEANAIDGNFGLKTVHSQLSDDIVVTIVVVELRDLCQAGSIAGLSNRERELVQNGNPGFDELKFLCSHVAIGHRLQQQTFCKD